MEFVLKNGAKEKLYELYKKGVVNLNYTGHNLEDGSCYVPIKADLMDYGLEFPKEFLDLVSRVTDKNYFSGKRNHVCGVYRHGGATLAVTNVRVEKNSEIYVWYSISGPTFESVRVLFTLFRQGKLEPEENWDGEDS